MNKITRDTVIKVNMPICLFDRWVIAVDKDKDNPGYLPKCKLQFFAIVWAGHEDNEPAFSFRILDDPSDINYPEFSFKEIKTFFDYCVFEEVENA